MSAGSSEDTLTVDRPQEAASETTPRRSWFVSLVWLLVTAQFSWAIAGVALAMAGVFSLSTLLPTWAVVGVALWIASRPARRAAAKPVQRSTSWIRLAAIIVAAAAVVFNGAF